MFRSMPSRRDLIAATLAVGLYPQGRAPADVATEPWHAALAAVCGNLPPVAAIGRACRRALPPAVGTPERLTGLILTDLPAANRGSAPALAETLRARSRLDFRRGRIVSVDGWMLSLTEVRLYALAGLLRQSSLGTVHSA
jgi:hypothetical protein